MKKLLLVEDDATLRDPLAESLRKQGFEVTAVASLSEARQQPACDLVLLDWELPDGHGVDLIREWRGKGKSMPVILLTARIETSDKVLGLELGADDYITKPFVMSELVARVRARLRVNVATEPEVLSGGGIEMDLKKRAVKFRGREVELSKMEFDLLKFFLENPGRALVRDEILNKVWGFENFPSSRTVDTHVLFLRQKFAAEMFETLRGIGYRFKAAA